MPDPALISDPQKVTAPWLTEVLRGSGALREASVVDLEREQIGTGQMGENVRFRLTYDTVEANAPACVVGKFPSSDPTSRATGVAQGVYLKEVRFYQELRSTVGIRTPRCHFADIEPPTGAFVLVLEDLSPAVQGDQLAGCSLDQAATALGELARLHAPRWCDPALGTLEWLGQPSPEAGQLLQALYQAVWPGFVERYGTRIPADQLALAERLGRNLVAWSGASTEGPHAITHGDYRVDNMLFATAEGGYPLAVVDWQTCGHGTPVADASYFLGASVLPELRRAHERKLIEDYHAALVAGGVSGFDFEACWADYERLAFSGVIMAVVASMIVQQSERGDEMFIAMATRALTHALDLDSARFLPEA